uniref:Uncharacterized protein n=1 Tax=viral metagenome TaxID=1070528 RepID=A0A6C0H8Z4_9ZZZZ
MSSSLESQLLQNYKSMMGLNNIYTDTSNNSTFLGYVTVNSNLYVSGYTIFNNVTTSSDINILKKLLTYSNTVCSSFNISGNAIINNTLTINSILNISGNANINNLIIAGNTNIIGNIPININNNLNVTNITTIQGTLLSSIIQSVNNTLSLNGNTIIVGNNQSKVYIQGTSTYIGTTQLNTTDKLITLNKNTLLLPTDNGYYSGIQIRGISGTGFINTSVDASKYLIQAPNTSNAGYIVSQDVNNNINILGVSTLQNTVSMNSSLYISNISIFQGSLSTNSLLYVTGKSGFNNNISLNSLLNISGNTIIKGNVSVNNRFNISQISIITKNVSVNSNLYITNNSIINGNVSILNNLNISNNSIIRGNTSINTLLYVSGISIFSNSVSISSLSIIGTTNINNMVTMGTLLLKTGLTIINNKVSVNSLLNISGSTIIKSNITAFGNIYIKGQTIAPLTNYTLNSAARVGGVPVGGLYRSGGIVMIRINDTPPTIYFSSSSTLTVYLNTSYTDPGAYALDYKNNSCVVYLNSISFGGTNYLSNRILINGTSTLISQTSTFSAGSYTATYQATDSVGLVGYNYRKLNVVYNFTLSRATFSATSFSTLFSIPGGSRCRGIAAIYYTAGTYVALASIDDPPGGPQDANIWTSTDYYNWKCINISSLPALSGISKPNICHNDGASCCAFGNGYLALYIPDITYPYGYEYFFIYNISANTLTPFPSNVNKSMCRYIANVNNYCLYYLSNTNDYVYSTDGITLTKSTTKIMGNLCAFNYVNGVYIAVAGLPTELVTYISTDRITWTQGSSFTTLFANNNVNYYANNPHYNAWWGASNGNMCIYAGISSNDYLIINHAYVLSSTDGVNWTLINMPYFPVVMSNPPGNYNGGFNLLGAFWSGSLWIVRFQAVGLEWFISGNPYGSLLQGFYFSQNGIDWNVSSSLFYNGGPTNYDNNNGGHLSTMANGHCILPFSYNNDLSTKGLWYTS